MKDTIRTYALKDIHDDVLTPPTPVHGLRRRMPQNMEGDFAKATNNRQGGSGQQLDEMMDLLQAFDPNRPSCPTRRQFVASRHARRLAGRSAPLRPSCAPPRDEHQMRSLPLGIQGGFTLAQRWAKYLCRKTKDNLR